MPRSALAAFPERPLPHAYPVTRSRESHFFVAPLILRPYQLEKWTRKKITIRLFWD